MRKLILENKLSPEKTKKIEQLEKKIMKFAQKNGIARLSVCFMSKECGVGDTDNDYITVSVYDRYENRLTDISLWG